MDCNIPNIFLNPNFKQLHAPLYSKQSFHLKSSVPISISLERINFFRNKCKFISACTSPGQELLVTQGFEIVSEKDVNLDAISLGNEEKEKPTKNDRSPPP